jgi:hypothetical protein
MKTYFQEEEIRGFIKKKIAELEGANILLSTQDTSDINLLDISTSVDKIMNLGRMAGELEGKLEMLKDIQKFFEI